MAKRWSDVSASPEFQALSLEDREAARRQYFEQVVAPRIDQQDLQDAWSQFDAATSISIKPSRESTAGAGRGEADFAAADPRRLDQTPVGGRGGKRSEMRPYVAGAGGEQVEDPDPTRFQEQQVIRGDATAGQLLNAPRKPGTETAADLESMSRSPAAIEATNQEAIDKARRERFLRESGEFRAQPERGVIDRAIDATIAKPLDQSAGGLIAEAVGDAARGIRRAGQGLASSAWSGIQAGAEAVGADAVAGVAGQAGQFGREERARTNNASDPNSLTQQVFESTFTSVPLVAGLGAGPGLAAMMAQSAANDYGESRDRGLTHAEAAPRAAWIGIAEGVGERFGLPQLSALFSGAIAKASPAQFGKVLADLIWREQIGEQVTLALQNAYEATGPQGTKPNLTLEQYLTEAAETAAVTAGQSLLTGGLAAGVKRLAPRREPELSAIDIARSKGFLGGPDGGQATDPLVTPPATPGGPAAPPRQGVSFTPPDSAVARAGVTPIVAPVGPGAAPQVAPVDQPPAPAGDTLRAEGVTPPAAGRPDFTRAMAGIDDRQAAAATQPAADAETAGPAAADATWTGRRGSGYVTEADAQQALEGRRRKQPDLDWKVEQRQDGNFELRGYMRRAQETTDAAADPQAAGAAVAAESGRDPGGLQGSGVGGDGVQRGLGQNQPIAAAGAPAVRGLSADQVQADLRKIQDSRLRRGEDTKLAQVSDDGSEGSRLAVTMAGFFRAPIAFIRDLNGRATFNAVNIDDRVYINVDSDLAPIAGAFHEIGHSLPQDIKDEFLDGVLAITTPETRQRFVEDFDNYGKLPERKQLEELAMKVLEREATNPRFLNKLFTKLNERVGDNEFTRVVGALIKSLDRIIAGFTQRSGRKYVTDLERFREIAAEAYVKAAERVGMNPDSVTEDRAQLDGVDVKEISADEAGFSESGGEADAQFSERGRSDTVGDFEVRVFKDGGMEVRGDTDEIRSRIPEDVKGRITDNGVRFTTSDAARVRAVLEGRGVAYSRAGQVIDRLPMKNGKYLGAPPGYDTPAKITKLRRILRQLAEEGAQGRFWYENSSAAVLHMTGGNKQEARKFVALLAIYSPQAKVDANSTFALRAWAQYKAGHPISVKTAVMDRKATEAMADVDKFWSGEKTGNFFHNLLREIDESTAGKQGATIDMWMMRAGQYPGDAPTKTQYAFMEHETNRLARDLGWEPQQVQAAIWVAMKARMENAGVKKRTEAKSEKRGWIKFVRNAKGKKVRVIVDAQKHRDNWLQMSMEHDVTKKDTSTAKFDFADGIRRHIGQISFETRPGVSTGVLPGIHSATYARQLEFHQAVQRAFYDEDTGEDLLAARLGLLLDEVTTSPGVWQGQVSPSSQMSVAMAPAKGGAGKSNIDDAQKKLLDVYAAVAGLVARQEGVGWHRPFYSTTKAKANGLDVDIGRPINTQEAIDLERSIGRWMEDNGRQQWYNQFAIISSPRGVRLVAFGAATPKEMQGPVLEAASAALPDYEHRVFASDNGMPTNDWKENQNGQGYVQRIRAEGRSDVLEWARTVLAPRVQDVFRDFSDRYGWGDPGSIDFSEVAAEDIARPAEPPRGSGARGDAGDGSRVVGIHYGQAQGLSVLTGSAYGRGIRGAEAERLAGAGVDPRIKRRVYFYLSTTVPAGKLPQPEAGLGGHVYRATLGNMFDVADKAAAQRVRDLQRALGGGANAFESAVLDAGYRGYVMRDQGTAVVLNADVPVAYEGVIDWSRVTNRTVQRSEIANETRKEGDELVRRPTSEQLVGVIRARPRLTKIAPSFTMLYGEARVKEADVDAANEALAEHTDFQFSELSQAEIDEPYAGTDRRLVPLAGAPKIDGATGPDPSLVAVAEKYARDNSIELKRQSSYVEVDEDRARRIAAAYEAMPHAPQDQRVREAYQNLIRQTRAQYDALVDAGYQFWFMDPAADPYGGNPWNAMRDLRANKRMAVFPTEAGFGSGATELNVEDNPLLEDTGIEWGFGDVDGPAKRVLANDLFRAVHDAFGHGLEGAGFRARGEENAWQAHVRLFTGSAVGAITSETRGQNSWLNYGPYGEKNQTAKVEDTVFADQKTGLMPEWTWREGVVDDGIQASEQPTTARGVADAAMGMGVRLNVTEGPRRIDLLLIERTTGAPGAGGDVMRMLTAYADRKRARIYLDLKAGAGQLGDYYASFGFEPIDRVPGRPDWESGMVRQPGSAVAPAAPAARTGARAGRQVVVMPSAAGGYVVMERVGRGSREIGRADTEAEAQAIADSDDGIQASETSVAERRLLAPNGKPSKLTPEQYRQVRTPAFKRWFGDWEKHASADNPEGSLWGDDGVSKAVDPETREPMVLYHGSANAGFARFWETGGRQRGDLGIFLTDNKSMARSYVRRGRAVDVTRQMVDDVQDDIIDKSGGVYGLFVNIRSASEEDFKGANWDGQMTGMDLFEVYDADGDVAYTADGRDVMSRDEAEALADEIGGTFEEASHLGFSTDYVVSRARDDGVDGAIMYKVMDDGGGPGYNYEPSTVVAVFDPRNVKSADFNEGSFDDSADIRFSETPWYSALARASESGRQPDLFAGDFATKRTTVDTDIVISSNGDRARGGNVNSEGKQIAQTKQALKNFWSWFGASEATDDRGRPLLMYHSTNGDITRFEVGRKSTNNYGLLGDVEVSRSGIFMTPSKSFSQEYLREGSGQNVMPVYASIKNPLDLRSGLSFGDEQVLEEAGVNVRYVINAQNYWELFDNSDDGSNDFVTGLRAAGYDGAIFREASPGGESDGGVTYVAFDPSQVKSALGNRGTFSADDERISFSEEPTRWYSALARAIEKGPAQAPADQWRAFIKGLPAKGVKPDEIEWSGIEEWLKLQTGKVPRQAVVDYLNANGVKVEEVVLGAQNRLLGREADEALYEWVEENGNLESPNFRPEWQEFYDSVLGGDTSKETLAIAKRLNVTGVPRDLIQGAYDGFLPGANPDPKYGQYTLPGGTRYREVLLTLPERRPLTDVWRDMADKYGDDDPRTIAVKKAARAEAGMNAPKPYRSSHWDAPNVLAHLRLNDRVDADGRRVLFVEEIQSDWGQQGKKDGFMRQRRPGEMPEGYTLLDEAELARKEGLDIPADEVGPWQYRGPSVTSRVYRDRDEAINAAWKDASGEYSSKPPLAPFVTKTDAWVSLALKRVITMAVRDGYDRVAFVTGEQSAERYDLSKQVDDLRYGDGMLVALKGGAIVVNKEAKPDDLPDIVGKEVADRLLKAPEMPGNGYRRLTGLDLKVGGEGMKTFYDVIVPNAVKPLLKKLGGGALVEVNIGQGNLGINGRAIVNVETGDVVSTHGSQQLAIKKLASMRLKQPGFDITTAMREAAGDGLPMFSEMGRRDVTQTPEFKRWFGDSKVVDADGKPLVAYHGTNVDFEAFETSGANELGSWFTAPAKRYGDAAAVDDARAAAEDFAATQVDLYGGADIVVPVYLSIKSPKVFRGYGAFERWSDNSADGRALRERLIAEGHDGVVIRNSRTDGGALRDDWVAFEPEQIKSAIGNDGSFDIDDTDIRSSEYGKEKDRFGRKFLPGQRQPKRPRASDLKVGSVKSDVTVNVLTRAIDDEYPIVNAARKAGSAVADAWKIAVEALPGRTADAINQAHKQLIDPMVKAMGEAAKSLKMDSAQLIDAYGIYRLAKHAPERNKTLRANGSKKANPAGMSEAEAAQWMTFFRGEPGLLRALESFDPMLKAIQDRTDSVKLAAGLITQEEIDSRSDWDWYVSLRGDPGADETGGVKGGGGWNNDIDPRARGRDSLSANPVINTVKMLENAIRLAEMARVKKATYEMAEAHPDILQAKVTRVFNRPFFDEDGNFARAFPNTDKFSTDSVVYRNGDVEYKIEIGDGKVINAIKKLENRQLDPVIRGFGKLVSVLGRLFTQFSPHFPLVNFIRDLQQQIAYIAGQDIDIGGRKISSAKAAFMIMSRYPKTFAAAVSEVMGRTPTGKYTRLARELHEQGGMSGFSKMFSDEEALADFTKRVQWKAGKAMSSLAWNKFVDFVGDVSEVFEMTTRVAAYSVMRDMGMDAAAGANFTKNLMNFSKAGTSVRGFLGNFYMFLKPSIQDVYLTSKLLRTKKGAIVLGSMYAGAVALYAMLRELSGDDDEDPRLKRMDTRNASERRAYYILPYWGKDGDKPLRIPVGFGLPRIAWGLAVTTVDGALNPDFDQAAVADGVVKSLTSTLSPMQLSENNMFTNTPEFLATTFAPTLALPVIELAMNRSKAGNTITRSGNYQQLPDYAQSFSSTPKEFKDAAEWMYDTTNGKIDVAPETLQHIMRSYGGGPAGVMLNALQSGERQRQGQEITRRDVPIVQAFTGAPDRYPEKRFRDMSKEVDELTRKIKDSEIRGTPLAQRLMDENETLLAIKSDIDRIERMESKAIADIRQLYRQDYNAAAREARALEIEMRAEKQALLDAYNEMKRSSK